MLEGKGEEEGSENVKDSFRVRPSPGPAWGGAEGDHTPPKLTKADKNVKSDKNGGGGGKTQILAQIQALIKKKSTNLSSLKVQDGMTKAAAAVNKFRPRVSKKTERRAARTGKDLTRMIVNAKRGMILSFTSLFLAAFTELYPSMPHYNVSLAFFSLYLHHLYGSIEMRSDEIRKERKAKTTTAATLQVQQSASSFYGAYSVVTLLSIFVDLDWLVSNDRPVPLDDTSTKNPYKPQSMLSKVTGLALGANIFLKLAMVWSLTKGSKEGFGMLKKIVVRPLRYFVPTFGMPQAIKKDIVKRLIAIGWIELVCALGMLIIR